MAVKRGALSRAVDSLARAHVACSPAMVATVYVGNLPVTVTEAEVRALFESEDRRVVRVRLGTDRQTGRLLGFGFVELESAEQARSAIEALHARQFEGRALTVTSVGETPVGGAKGMQA